MKKLIVAAALAAVFGLAGCNLGTSGFGTITIPGEWPPSNYRPGDRLPIGPEDLDMGEIRVGGQPQTFLMGSPTDEIGRANDGREDQRSVTISAGFWISETPVTVAQWYAVMGSIPSDFPTFPGDAPGRRPVTVVSWFDALVFANRLSESEGFTPAYMINGSTNPGHWGDVPRLGNLANIDAWLAVQIVPGSDGFRLPTDAQWEFAARAGTTTAFSNGTQDWTNRESLDRIGWFDFNSGGVPREVMRKEPNPWGLYDIHGNVEEWVWDLYGENRRMTRGGNVFSSGQFARSAYKFRDLFSFTEPASAGFRLVRP
ncbi:MAG: formylglycine-generating enzyme family protein [Spirochaetes bacterium]|nr:formylglycine-generating enzyme family protein [Spirochaetota bacterium]